MNPRRVRESATAFAIPAYGFMVGIFATPLCGGSTRRAGPRDVVTVSAPGYAVGHWWEQPRRNSSALRLKARRLFEPGVMVVGVPSQLASSASGRDAEDLPAPGKGRRARGDGTEVAAAMTR